MYQIVRKISFTGDTYLMEVMAPRLAQSALPGQFLIVKMKENSERIPLTITDYDVKKGTVTIVFKAIGDSTRKMAAFQEGESFCDVAGPLGKPSDLVHLTPEELKNHKVVFIGGGVGIAPIYPQVKWLYDRGVKADCIIGVRNKDLLFYDKELSAVSNLIITSDDGSVGRKGLVTDVLRDLVKQGNHYDSAVAIGPMIMMKFATQTASELGIPCVVSLNSIMVDGTGMCGACRVSVAGETKFTCVDGPEFLGADIDFDEAMKRQAMYNHVETRKQLEEEEKRENHQCHIGGICEESFDKHCRVPILEQDPKVRAQNFDEVCLGYNAEEAMREAQRCLQCKNPQCVMHCPVNVKIPQFIAKVAIGDFEAAARIINEDSALPAICGRVCPQESQCEGSCVMGKKFEAIAIGKLERFVGDWAIENNISFVRPIERNGHKVAIVGSGPSSLTCASDLVAMGYEVSVFEALHEYGGVLTYGIPSFRLPKEKVVKHEVENIQKMGAHFEKDVVIGRTVTIDELIEKENFDAIFVGSGAGFPNFMNIPGENSCGVVSANEFLTRNNLLFAYKEGYDTPNFVGKRIAVVGGGNVAMDAARTALRLGSEVNVIYRRSEKELPARAEEVHHAKEEGVKFHFLCNPTEILEDEKGWVKGIQCIRMELGEPDASGRCKPIKIAGSEFILDVDMVIMALGTSPNPLIGSTTPNLKLNTKGCIVADEMGRTSRDKIFAGGDAVSGAATVILAMKAGKQAAQAIHEKITNTTK